MNFSFESFADGSFDYDKNTQTHTGLHLHAENADIGGGKINTTDIDVLKNYPDIEVFDFSLNFLTTEQVAWIVANFPNLKGFALKARHDCELFKSNEDLRKVPATIIVGKRKPSLKIEGNEEQIKNYELKLEALVKKYKGKEYSEAF